MVMSLRDRDYADSSRSGSRQRGYTSGHHSPRSPQIARNMWTPILKQSPIRKSINYDYKVAVHDMAMSGRLPTKIGTPKMIKDKPIVFGIAKDGQDPKNPRDFIS